MLPFVFEWHWDAGHMVFMGALWYALTIIGTGLTYAGIKSFIDLKKGGGHH
ncbi:MAG: hypothetical protein V1753_06535 [Pseudomonadota bacterium]